MQVERKALYNSLRLNYQRDPSLQVKSWQVQDYRLFSLEELHQSLYGLDIHLDQESFLAYSNNFDSPEELAQCLVEDEDDIQVSDHAFLILFELWRRYLPQKQSISIFCDELDYQIHSYDEETLDDESIQDALSNLEEILKENTDEGSDPPEVFKWISLCCAHDLESFIYDFIARQIDEDNFSYAADLIDGFYDFIEDSTAFDFLKVRVIAQEEPLQALEIINDILQDTSEDPDFELYLDILHFLVDYGEEEQFLSLLQTTLLLMQSESDFKDLLEIAAEFYNRRDIEELSDPIQRLMDSREHIDDNQEIRSSDAGVLTLTKEVLKL